MNPIGDLAEPVRSANVGEKPGDTRFLKELKSMTDQLVEAVMACDWEETSNLSCSLLLEGRTHIGVMVNEGGSVNPFLIVEGLFKALGRPELQFEGEMKHLIARAARVFLEISCMKSVMEGERPLNEDTKEELSKVIDRVEKGANEHEVGLCHELKCATEALKAIDRPDFMDFLRQLKDYISGFTPGQLPSLLKGLSELHQSICQGWYSVVLCLSWLGNLSHTNLAFFQAVRGQFQAQLEEKQVALSAVELYGSLLWKGTREVALEALEGEGGLLNLINHGNSKWRKNHNWQVRYRATQILATLYSHPDEVIVRQVNKALLEQRLKEGNKQVKPLLKQCEENSEIANRWKQLYEEAKTTIIQEGTQKDESLKQRQQQLEQKQQELIQLEKQLTQEEPSQNRQTANLQKEVHALKQDLEQLTREITDLAEELDAYRENLLTFQLLNTVDDYHAAQPSSASESSSSSTSPKQYTEIDLEEMKFSILESLAHQGLPAAERELGRRYRDGKGTSKDPKLAFQWIQRGALQGHAPSQNTLGCCFDQGVGTKVNWEQAVKWYRLAAEQGHASAQTSLGHCYHTGQGVKLSFEEAVKWYRLAVKQGHVRAQNNLGHCYHTGLGVKLSFEEAVKWYRLAADQNDAYAQRILGFCYKKGEGVQQRFEVAVRWYRLAAEQGDTDAQINLGYCYAMGQGVQRSLVEAVKWYHLAADQGCADAQNILGRLYKSGKGVKQSLQNATKWYHLAAAQGHTGAANALKHMEKECSNSRLRRDTVT